MKVEKSIFGKNGEILYSIKNNNGFSASFSSFGARIVNALIPLNGSNLINVVLGFKDADEYRTKGKNFGATIGRVAGRISNGEAIINKQKYQFIKNENNKNTLHGGGYSFESKNWNSKVEEKEEEASVIFSLTSPDREYGFPGNLKVYVKHTVTNNNEWIIEYMATTDKETIFNPTNHVFFNLNGKFSKDVGNHTLKLKASKYVVLDSNLLPTGELNNVQGTSLDYRNGDLVSKNFKDNDEEVKGLDHSFVFDDNVIENQVELQNYNKSISLKMTTDCPAVIVYTLNSVADDLFIGTEKINKHAGITLEAQKLPDAINHSGFGNIVISPEERYYSKTTYKFEWVKDIYEEELL